MRSHHFVLNVRGTSITIFLVCGFDGFLAFNSKCAFVILILCQLLPMPWNHSIFLHCFNAFQFQTVSVGPFGHAHTLFQRAGDIPQIGCCLLWQLSPSRWYVPLPQCVRLLTELDFVVAAPGGERMKAVKQLDGYAKNQLGVLRRAKW
jgi:hypothetical protein